MAKLYLPPNLLALLDVVGVREDEREQFIKLTPKDRYNAVVSPVEFLEERFGRTRAPPTYKIGESLSNDTKAEKIWKCRLQIGTFCTKKSRNSEEKSKFEAALHFAVYFMENVNSFNSHDPESLHFDSKTKAILCCGINAETFLEDRFKYTKEPVEFTVLTSRNTAQFNRPGSKYEQKLRYGTKTTHGKGDTLNEARREAAIKMLYKLGFIKRHFVLADDVMEIPQSVEVEVRRMVNMLRVKCNARKVPFMVDFRSIEGMDSQCRIFAMGNTAVGIGAGSRLAEFLAAKKILCECGYADDIARLEQKWRPVPASQNESSTMALKPEVKTFPSEKWEAAVDAGPYQWTCKIVMGNDYVRVCGGSEYVKYKAANKMLLTMNRFKPFTIDHRDHCDTIIEGYHRPRAYQKLIGEVDKNKPNKEMVRRMLKMAGYLHESIFNRLINYEMPEVEEYANKTEAPLEVKTEVDESKDEFPLQRILTEVLHIKETEPEEAKALGRPSKPKPKPLVTNILLQF